MAEEDKSREHGCSLIEHLATAGEGHGERVQPARSDGNGDQDHHVQRPGPERPERAVEEDPRRVEDHRQAQQEHEHVVAQAERRGSVEADDVPADGRHSSTGTENSAATTNLRRMSANMSAIDPS